MTIPALSGSRTISALAGRTARGAGGIPCTAGGMAAGAAGASSGALLLVAGGMVLARFCAWPQIGKASATTAHQDHNAKLIAEGAFILAPVVLAAAENASNAKPRATGVQGAVLLL